MVIIGLGTAGINIGKKFEKWPQYKVVLPHLDKLKTVEEYEENCPDFSELLKDVEGEVWFFVCGAAKVASASLRILEKIKHCQIKILYIFPDLDLLADMARKRHKVVFNVFQQYSRSGLFDSMYIVSNSQLEEIVGSGTIMNYYSNINDAIASVVHYYNIYRNTEPVFGAMRQPKEISRLRTFGLYDLEKNEEKLFFLLDNCTEIGYIYNITEEELQNNQDILPKIKARIKEKVSANIAASFAVFSTEFEENFCHVVSSTHFIQEN